MFREHTSTMDLLAASLAVVAFWSPVPATQQQSGEHWWVWVLIVLAVLLVLWWCLRDCIRRRAGVTAEAEKALPPTAADDLQLIEGIGPKISGLLQAANITTFAQLAGSDVSRLEQIVRGAGITIADPTTWPEQAALAAAGKWDELKVLQEELRGGRRA